MNMDAELQGEFFRLLDSVQIGIETYKRERTEDTRAVLIKALLEARRFGSANDAFLVGFPDLTPDPPVGPMVCRQCGCGIADEITLYRVNKPGELPAIWGCQDHANLEQVDPIVRDISQVIASD